MERENVFETIVAEFGRDPAAARRYENPRYGKAYREGLAGADIPRRMKLGTRVADDILENRLREARDVGLAG